MKKKVIIVGGGTAGLLIAENLKNNFDVVVLEKSKFLNTPLLNRVPLLIGPLYRKKILKYIKRIEIVAHRDRLIPFFESCILGGASVINGCVHALGLRSLWDNELRKYALGFRDVNKVYKKIYTTKIFGLANKIKLRLASSMELDQAFFNSLERNGLKSIGLESADQPGFGKVINTVGLIFRSSVFSILGRKKFKIFTGQDVSQIKHIKNGQFQISANSKEHLADYVIVSSGVIGTNRLFLEKRVEGIDDAFLHRYMIGNNIKDHPNVRVNVRASKSFGSLNEINESFIKKLFMLIKHLLGFDTLLLGTGATSGVHLDLDGDGLVDTRIHLLQFSEMGRHKSDGKDFCSGPGFSLSITPIQTMSSGKIVFDEFSSPIVDPNYFDKTLDLKLMKAALDFCLELLKSEPLKSYVEEIEDYSLIKEDPDSYIKNTFFSGHHLIGGCSNVIDANFEMQDNPGIFICDASVFSNFVSSNIHAPVILLAKLFSDKFISRLDCNTTGDNSARI